MAPIFSLIGFITLLAGIQTVGDHKKIVILRGKVSIFQKYYGLPMGKKEIPFEQIKDVKVRNLQRK